MKKKTVKLERLHTILLFVEINVRNYKCSVATANVTKLSPLPNVLPKMLTDFNLFWLFIPYMSSLCVHVFGGGHFFFFFFRAFAVVVVVFSHRISGVASNGGVCGRLFRIQIHVLYILVLLFSFACDIVVFVFALFAILLQPLAQMQHLILRMSRWTNKREKKLKE